ERSWSATSWRSACGAVRAFRISTSRCLRLRNPMSVVDDPKTFGRARLSFANVADIDEFVATLERYERGELTPDQWRAFRLVRGTYGQRQAAGPPRAPGESPPGRITRAP